MHVKEHLTNSKIRSSEIMIVHKLRYDVLALLQIVWLVSQKKQISERFRKKVHYKCDAESCSCCRDPLRPLYSKS